MEDDDMAKSMTTSVPTMTEGQIARAIEIFSAKLRKHAAELPSDAVQIVFGQPELGAEWLAVLRKRVEALSDIIVRHVKVDRKLAPQQVLDATGRNQYTDAKVVASMPHGEGEEIDVFFFRVSRYVSDDEAEKEYALRGFKPADPYSLARVNTDDPAFAETHPNGTHWKDANGNWCYAAFYRWGDERHVHVNRYDNDWNDYWWFAGVRR